MEETKQLREALKAALKTGNFEELFFNDLFDLWKSEGVSPEVVLREIRALEGTDEPLMIMNDDRPIPIWFVDSDAIGPDIFYKTDPSATKDVTQFTREDSPLKGLWHKHYYIHRSDFLIKNVKNEIRRCKSLENASPMMQIMGRIAAGAATGEWIIFKREGGANTYLCLAKHNDGDIQIHERIKKVL